MLRRLNGKDGTVVWEFKEVSKDIPLQVSTNTGKIFVISLHGAVGSYNLKVSVHLILPPESGWMSWSLGPRGCPQRGRCHVRRRE